MAEKAKKTNIPAKKVTPTKTTTTQQSVSSPVSAPSSAPEKYRAAKAIALIVIVCILMFLMAYLFKGVFVAASVNGEAISRIVVIRSLEKQSGQMVLDNLITKKLILQEADNRKIVIVQKDIDDEIKSISDNLKKQGTTLEKAMESQGMSQDELNDEIRVQIALKRMTSGDVKVTDKEIEDFVAANDSSFPEGTTDEQKRNLARTQLQQQISGERTQNIISELQKKAKIIHYAGY